MMVRTRLAQVTPTQPFERMIRSTVHRARWCPVVAGGGPRLHRP